MPEMKGTKFKDKVTQHVYMVKKASDWLVLMEREDNRYEILTTIGVLKTFYEEVKQ